MQDILWKAIIESLFADFLLYFFPNWAKEKVDFQRGFEFLDKELERIYPSASGKRFADKLVKVFLKNGEEKWVLVHVEVQGYEDSSFPERMFEYFYRIRERYKRGVMSLVILTDASKKFHPKKYVYAYCDTQLEFRFPTFKLLTKSDEELKVPGNIFSVVMLAAKRAIKKKQKDEEILFWKISLVKDLLVGGYEKEKIRNVLIFIDNVMNFKHEQAVRKYEDELRKLVKTPTNMGIEQAVKEYFREKGFQEGKLEGKLEGRLEGKLEGRLEGKLAVAENCLKRGFSIAETVAITELAQEIIENLARKLGLLE